MSRNHSPNTLLFDVGEVLIQNHNSSRDIKDITDVDETLFRPIWNQLISEYGSGKCSVDEFWEKFCTQLDMLATSELRDALSKKFIENYTPNTRILQRIHHLGARGYRLAVLSDTIPDHSEPLREFGLFDDFDSVFLSHEIGHRKSPTDDSAYTHVLNALQAAPEDVLFIDDRTENLVIPEQLGIQTVHATDDDNILASLQGL